MSFEKIIGFGINPDKPKGSLRPLSPKDLFYFNRMGVEPIFHNLKDRLPPGNKEPEPKILVPRPRCFADIRALFLSSSNSCMILDQLYEDKNPLTSILLDTKFKNLPTADLARKDHSLRFRFETRPDTNEQGIYEITQRDFNEKSALLSANIIGGCADRDERECEIEPDETSEQGYNRFIQKYRTLMDPAFCDGIAYSDLSVAGGYLAARNEYGFAVKHPKYDVLFVFEACEDRFDTLTSNMCEATAELCEFEFEPKQVWGKLPPQAQSPEGFRLFLYSFMTDIRDHVHHHIPDSIINLKSKAELAKEHMMHLYGNHNQANLELTLREIFRDSGIDKAFIPDQYSMLYGTGLEDTLKYSLHDIGQRGSRLHYEKMCFNTMAPKPDVLAIGSGNKVIEKRNDAPVVPFLAPIAAYA